MQRFEVDQRIVDKVKGRYPCPQIFMEWLREKTRCLIEGNKPGHEPSIDISQLLRRVFAAIENSSFTDTAEPGTGLPLGINKEKVHTFLHKPMVLELVHLTEIGVSAMTLEGVRQGREHRVYLDRVARVSSSQQGHILRELDWLRTDLEPYPRRRLKMILSDGKTELPAIEFERLLDFELGITPMGTKIYIENLEIIGGTAYVCNENLVVIGGGVPHLQKQHRIRFYEELGRRMDEDDLEAIKKGSSPEELYQQNLA